MQRGGLWSPGDRMRTPLTKVGMLPPEAQVSMPWSTQSGAEGTPSPRPPAFPWRGTCLGVPGHLASFQPGSLKMPLILTRFQQHKNEGKALGVHLGCTPARLSCLPVCHPCSPVF